MPRKPRQTPEPPPSDLSRLSDGEVAVVDRTLRAIDGAIRMRDRVRRGEFNVPAQHFDEMIETLQGDLDLACRTPEGEGPH